MLEGGERATTKNMMPVEKDLIFLVLDKIGSQKSSMLVARLATVVRNKCGSKHDVSFYCCFVGGEGPHALGCGWLHRILGCTATLPDGSNTGIYLWLQTGGDF